MQLRSPLERLGMILHRRSGQRVVIHDTPPASAGGSHSRRVDALTKANQLIREIENGGSWQDLPPITEVLCKLIVFAIPRCGIGVGLRCSGFRLAPPRTFVPPCSLV